MRYAQRSSSFCSNVKNVSSMELNCEDMEMHIAGCDFAIQRKNQRFFQRFRQNWRKDFDRLRSCALTTPLFCRRRVLPEDYRFIATSRTGFVQQVVCSYVRHGYRFYVSGRVPEGKNPREIDEKLLALYDIRKTDSQRYRAKKRNDANLQYIRFE